jgi:hypothetical protein
VGDEVLRLVSEHRFGRVASGAVLLGLAWSAIPLIPVLLTADSTDEVLGGWLFYVLFFAALPGVLALWPATVLAYCSAGRWPLLVTVGAATLLSLIGFQALAGLADLASRDASEPILCSWEWYAFAGGMSLTWGVAIGMTQYAGSRLAGSAGNRAGVILVSALAGPGAGAISIGAMVLVGSLTGASHAAEFSKILFAVAVPAGVGAAATLTLTYAAAVVGIRTALHRALP